MPHTAGPWVAGTDGAHRAWIADLHNGVGVFTERRFQPGEFYEWGDRAADADLIAAAPDMLTALKDFVSEIRAYSWPECDENEITGPLMRAADAAIAKAEGRTL